jgi:hypothetical protein
MVPIRRTRNEVNRLRDILGRGGKPTQAGPLRIGLYDLSGRLVRELLNLANAPATVHRIPVHGLSDQDEPFPSGLYFLRVRAVEGIATERVLITR